NYQRGVGARASRPETLCILLMLITIIISWSRLPRQARLPNGDWLGARAERAGGGLAGVGLKQGAPPAGIPRQTMLIAPSTRSASWDGSMSMTRPTPIVGRRGL